MVLNELSAATLGEPVGLIRCLKKTETMRLIYITSLSILLSITLYTCRESEVNKGRRLANKYCSACHLFPEPSLLDKKTWKNGVMPKMAFYLGLNYSEMLSLSERNMEAALKAIPANPMLTKSEFDLILNYYEVTAPDSIFNPPLTTLPLKQFEPSLWRSHGNLQPAISLIKVDTTTRSIWLCDRTPNLFQYGYDFQLKDSFKIGSPVSTMIFKSSAEHLLLSMGNMDPSDVSTGSLVQLVANRTFHDLIDSLNRPADFEIADLNNDNLDDYIICAFGNYTGAIEVYENLGKNNFKKYIISSLPGTRKVIVKDFDGDGLDDIMALITQGDEQIKLFSNNGKFQFKAIPVFRFPPVYGSSYFEMADMNGDGLEDIIYSNGDNDDFSPILKPYHGIRILLNKGRYQFEESWFYHMDGASQTIAQDFDKDGDVDIAAISFFPDFNNPQNGFVYLENENKGSAFKAYTTPVASAGRWLRMECADLDDDKDLDILLTALNFETRVPLSLAVRWREEKNCVLVLKNQWKK